MIRICAMNKINTNILECNHFLGGGDGGRSSVACPRRRKPYFRLWVLLYH
jgi:hypothetical protein